MCFCFVSLMLLTSSWSVVALFFPTGPRCFGRPPQVLTRFTYDSRCAPGESLSFHSPLDQHLSMYAFVVTSWHSPCGQELVSQSNRSGFNPTPLHCEQANQWFESEMWSMKPVPKPNVCAVDISHHFSMLTSVVQSLSRPIFYSQMAFPLLTITSF